MTPSQCGAGAATCPSIILTGSPIILRNLKVVNTNGQNPVDGVEVRTSQVRIENATVENFRYGLVVPESAGANHLTITTGVFRRTSTALPGSAGINIKSGHGHTIADVTVHCTETGLALTGGTSGAPNVVQGGAFSGTTATGASCAAHAGLFLQGGYVSATGTTEHPLTIADFKQGVILDPVGPMGIEGGTITNAATGVEVRNAALDTLAGLVLQPTTFTEVKQFFDFTTAAPMPGLKINWSKDCAKTITQTINNDTLQVCDTTVAENSIMALHGTFAVELCPASMPGTLRLYASASAVSSASFVSVCTLETGCHFLCDETVDGAPLALPLNTIVSPVIVTAAGATVAEKLVLETIHDADLPTDTAIGPLAIIPSPADVPNVASGEGENDAGLDAITGGGSGNPGGIDDGNGGGAVIVGSGQDGAAISDGGGASPQPSEPPFDPTADDHTDENANGSSTTQVLSGSFGGDGDGGGASGIAAPGVGGCSLIMR